MIWAIYPPTGNPSLGLGNRMINLCALQLKTMSFWVIFKHTLYLRAHCYNAENLMMWARTWANSSNQVLEGYSHVCKSLSMCDMCPCMYVYDSIGKRQKERQKYLEIKITDGQGFFNDRDLTQSCFQTKYSSWHMGFF